ncbi:MAG TPA: tetratricopeptide repeat protein [Polyangiales bacterium]|nr:tetratricopeptide repeat protein [Polyangiales bacterium]
MMVPRFARLAAIGFVVTLWSLISSPRATRAQDVTTANRELVSIEQGLGVLRKAPLRGSELRSPTYVEERLTDGELFYRLHDYVRASIILTDIVERFPRHAAFPDALYLLAESLYHATDYFGARARYRLILDNSDEPAFRARLQPALARLIEIAIKVRNFDGIEMYFERLARLPPSDIEDATAYFKAKYLYSVAVPADQLSSAQGDLPKVDPDQIERARVAFGHVSDKSPYAPQAHYFIGAIYTLRGQYTQAIEEFKRVVSMTPVDDTQREVVELALLALGRLYYETDQLPFAVQAYQSIPRTSNRFETALYEIAWTYIHQGDSTRAERSLEVLAVAAPESQYIPDAKLLRGNLLLRDGRYVAAGEVFSDVTKEFQPVRMQLDHLIAQQSNPHEYFQKLVRANIDQFDEDAFLPPLALRWARIEGDMKRAIEAVRDLNQARQLTRETSDIAARLGAALAGANRVTLFPELREQRETSIALRNRLSRVRQQLIAADEAQAKALNSPDLARLRKQRSDVEHSLAALPTQDADFDRRNSSLDDRYLSLDKQLSALEVQLLGMDARIVATDRFMTDTMVSPEQRTGVEAYRNELNTHRDAVVGYREQLAQLKQDLQISRLQVGVGDASYQRDDSLRAQYAELVQQERQLIASLGGRSGAEVDGMYRRISAVEASLDEQDRAIDQVVEDRANDMQRVLTEESGKLVGYKQSLIQLDSETEFVVGGLALSNYRQVQKRFYDLVLKADVGVVDVGWAEREEHRTRIELLTRERARSMQSLDDEFREIMDDRGKP